MMTLAEANEWAKLIYWSLGSVFFILANAFLVIAIRALLKWA